MSDPLITTTAAEVFTNFRSLSPTLLTQNGVLLVGLAYAVRGYTEDPETGDIGQYLGASPLVAAWPGLAGGEVVIQTTATVKLTKAIVRYFQETGAPSIAKGTAYGTAPNKLTHNSVATIWTGTGYSVALNAAVAVGDYVRIDNNSSTILHTRVAGFEAISGAMKVLVLEDNIPVSLRGVGVYFNVTIGQITDLALTNAQLTTSSTQVTVPAGITAATTRTGSAYAVIGATLFSGEILGEAATAYTATQSGSFTNAVQTVTTENEVAAIFPSYVNPTSNLGFAAFKGLSPPVLGLLPAPVRVIAPTDTLLASYQAVADLVRFRPDYSTIAVLTLDPTIIAVFKAMVDERAQNSLPTEMFIGQNFTTDSMIGTSTIATIDDSQTSGQQRTVSVLTGSPFATAIPGDTLKLFSAPGVYVPYVLATVISGQTATLTSSVPGGPLSNQTIEVWHHLTTVERALAIIAAAQTYADSSVMLTFPDGLLYNGVDVNPYFLAAYMAALRSYAAPQQSLAFTLPFDGLEGPDLNPYAGYLDDLAAGGVFTFDTTSLGQLFVRFPRTTDPSTMLNANEILVATVQFSNRYIALVLNPYLGIYRTSPQLYAKLRTAAAAAISALTNTNITTIGSIIVGGVIGSIVRDPTNSSRVIVPITLTVAGIAEDIMQLQITVVLG